MAITKRCRTALEMLRQAFADVPCPGGDSDTPHDYLRDMRDHLYDLDADELLWLLPRMLEDLALNPDDREGIDEVISHLDVKEHILHEEFLRLLTPEQVQYVKWITAEVSRTLESRYLGITPNQAAAIAEWLRCARGWPELAVQFFVVDSAIGYWSERAARTRKT